MSPPALRVNQNQNQNLDLPITGAELTLVKSPPEKGIYTVQSGDTQWTVSQKLGVDLVKLTQLNPEFAYRFPHIARVLQPGEKLALTLPTGSKSEHPNWSPALGPYPYFSEQPQTQTHGASPSKPSPYAEQPKPSLTVVPFKINKTEDNAISLQREWGLWPLQLKASRLMVQDVVPNILNGNIPMVMGASFLPKQAIVTAPVILDDLLAKSHAHTPEQGNIGATRLLIEGMFGREGQTAITMKVFKPDTSTRKAGTTDERNPLHGHEKTLFGTKHHVFAWASAAVSIELGRVSLSDDAKKRSRMATITTTMAVPLEHMYKWENPDETTKRRSFITYALGEESTYRILTEEARLKNILTGKLPLPDPFTLTNMKLDDQITLDTGGNRILESEWRRYVVPGVAGDFKYDSFHAEGNRLVITAVDEDATSHKITKVVVASGASITEYDKFGLGGALNPSMQSSADTDLAGKAGNLGAKVGLRAGYVRALAQRVKTTNDNHFNFVEIDLTQPKGDALYKQILKTGDIPPLPNGGNGGSHIKSHGKIDYELDKTSTVLQLAEYAEKIITPGYSSHMSASQNFELASCVHVNRKLTVNYASPDSYTKNGKKQDSNAEGGENYFPKFSFMEGEVVTNTVSFNKQTVSGDVETDKKSPDKHKWLNLLSKTYSVPASEAVNVLADYAAQTAHNGKSAYTGVTVLINDETLKTLKGQDAITHLKNLTDPNAGLIDQIFSNPTVDMVWRLDEKANTAEFLERLKHDTNAYLSAVLKPTHESLLDDILKNPLVGLEFQKKLENDVLMTTLSNFGWRSVHADNLLKLSALSNQSDVLKVLEELASTNPSSFIEMLNDFHDAGIKAGGNKTPYPISVTYVTAH